MQQGEFGDSPSYLKRLAAATREGEALVATRRYKVMMAKYRSVAWMVQFARTRRQKEAARALEGLEG